MIASILSIVLALLVARKIPKAYQALTFSLLLIALLPFVSYVLFGVKQVFSTLTAEQFFRDTGFLLKNCLAEPVNLCRKDAPVDWQFALPGIFIVVGIVWGIGVMAFNQRPAPVRPAH